MPEVTTAHATCPLCEATCGLELTLSGEQVTAVRGDAADVFSQGFICPKGASVAALESDPDRIRTPLIKRNGSFEKASWDEAFAEIDRRLPPLLERYGRNSIGVYVGNPAAHNMAALLYGRVLYKALGTRNIFTATTVDQMPKQVSCAHMFGGALSVPIPDLDRTEHLLILGANPLASNGSLMTAPDVRGRLRRIRERGGKVVVIDPRRTRTAEEADEHHFIRPGTDALLLAAIANLLFAEDLVEVGALGRAPERARAGPCGGGAVHTRGGCRADRDPGRGDRPHRAGVGRGGARRRLRADRHLHAGVRHARQLACRRPQRPHRQSRP